MLLGSFTYPHKHVQSSFIYLISSKKKYFKNPFSTIRLWKPKGTLRHIIAHCCKKLNCANDTANEICMVYGNAVISVHAVRRWFRKIRTGTFNLKGKECCGRPLTLDISLIKAMAQEVSDALKIP